MDVIIKLFYVVDDINLKLKKLPHHPSAGSALFDLRHLGSFA